MTRTFSLLVNPLASGGASGGAPLTVARLLREAGARVQVTYSSGVDAMPGLVSDAVARGDVVVAVGGDGMIASAAGLVAEAGGRLGVLPTGRGNDFARMLGIPAAPDEVARRLLLGEERRIDLLAHTGAARERRVLAGSVYAGVDARAAEIVDRSRWMPRRLQYPSAALLALATYRPAEFVITVDGLDHHARAANVVVANSAYYGGGMRIAPDADLADGLVHVVVIEAASRSQLIRSLPKVYDGSHVGLPEVTVLLGRRVELRADAASPVPAGGDGEPLGVLPGRDQPPVVVEVLPGALSVIA